MGIRHGLSPSKARSFETGGQAERSHAPSGVANLTGSSLSAEPGSKGAGSRGLSLTAVSGS